MGNNLFSDLLPYKDWVRINNGQRAHENLVSCNPVFFTSVFVSALKFPKFTFYMSLIHLLNRFFYTRCYLSFRGYNKATGLEELLKLELVVLMGAAFVSSASIMGVNRLWRLRRKVA